LGVLVFCGLSDDIGGGDGGVGDETVWGCFTG